MNQKSQHRQEIVIFSGKLYPELTSDICRGLGINPGQITSFVFSNNQRFVRLEEDVHGKHVFLIQTSTKDIDSEIIELFLMVDAAMRADAEQISLVLPYFPHVRSEKKSTSYRNCRQYVCWHF